MKTSRRLAAMLRETDATEQLQGIARRQADDADCTQGACIVRVCYDEAYTVSGLTVHVYREGDGDCAHAWPGTTEPVYMLELATDASMIERATMAAVKLLYRQIANGSAVEYSAPPMSWGHLKRLAM